MARIEASRGFIEGLRRILPVAPEVQRRLGIVPPRPGLTIRGYLESCRGEAA